MDALWKKHLLICLYKLDKRSSTWTAAERGLADLLTVSIEDFEEKHYALPKVSPVEVVIFMIDQHGLKQKDMIDVFGTEDVASEVLNGKRELDEEHIRRLSEKFHVSFELFL